MADAAVRVTAELLMKAVGCPLNTAASWAEPIDTACKEFAIKTGPDIAAFLAQTGHESGSFEHVVERLSYTADRIREIARRSPAGSRWRSLGPRADELAGKPQALANAAYGGRMGNGPESSGDGWKYRGRGLIQNTGKANYEAVRDTLREHHISCPDFDQYPDELASPKWAAMAAAAYWSEHDLSRLANAGEFDKITSRVNGGSAGQDDRRARYRRARQALTGA